MRVVVADDHALLRAGLVELLTAGGLDVVGQAGDADELIELTRRHLPDVVVLDIRMPPTQSVEGLQAAQRSAPSTAPPSASCCSPSTSRPATRWTCSPTARPASAIC